MKKLLLFLICVSFQIFSYVDKETSERHYQAPINMLYGIVDIDDIMPDVTIYDLIITK